MDNDVATILEVDEGSTRLFTGTLMHYPGGVETPIPGSALLTLTLTVRQDWTHAVVNSRNAQNVLNLNNVAVDNAGVLTWKIQTADTELINRALPTEDHRCLFLWTYNSGGETRAGGMEFILRVRRFAAK